MLVPIAYAQQPAQSSPVVIVNASTTPKTAFRDTFAPHTIQPATLRTMAAQIAKIDGLNVQLFVSVVKCESDFDNMAVGDNGTSFGIAQIHLPAHPEITKEEAYNPQWALNWMGRQWQAGNERAWSCYRILTK